MTDSCLSACLWSVSFSLFSGDSSGWQAVTESTKAMNTEQEKALGCEQGPMRLRSEACISAGQTSAGILGIFCDESKWRLRTPWIPSVENFPMRGIDQS